MEILFRRLVAKLGRLSSEFLFRNPTHKDVRMYLPLDCALSFQSDLPDGYLLRQYEQSDYKSYQRLMFSADMGFCPLNYWMDKIIPGGFFVIEHLPTGSIVASCFASELVQENLGRVGRLEWLACHPQHRGLRMGEFLAGKVSEVLLEHGLQLNILGTQDNRLGAIALYLRLGWKSFEHTEVDKVLWQEIRATLSKTIR